MNNDQAHKSLRMLRYIPVGSFMLMFSHVVLLCFGVDCPICEIIVILAGFYIARTFSKVFGFCLLHRMCIYYALTVMACIWLRRFPNGEYGLFGDQIDVARNIMAAIGGVLFVFLMMKQLKK